MEFLQTFAVAFLVFMVVDLLYLGVIAKNFVQAQLGHLMGKTNWTAAVIFYIQYVIGLIYFVIDPALEIGDPAEAWLNGALYGFFMYATYELTNWAILKKWPRTFVVADIAWGTVLGALVSILSFTILS